MKVYVVTTEYTEEYGDYEEPRCDTSIGKCFLDENKAFEWAKLDTKRMLSNYRNKDEWTVEIDEKEKTIDCFDRGDLFHFYTVIREFNVEE